MNKTRQWLLATALLFSSLGAQAGVIPVELISYGYDDAPIPGTGDLYLESKIIVNGVDHAIHARGVSVVVVDHDTGAVTATGNFDTWGAPGAGAALEAFLQAVAIDDYILAISIDSADNYIGPALDDLLFAGASSGPTTFRQSWALVGQQGLGAGNGLQDDQARFLGPATVLANLQISAVPTTPTLALLLAGLLMIAIGSRRTR